MAKRKMTAIIHEHTELASGIFSLWLKTDFAKEAKAGQFLGVFLKDKSKILARPISICDVDAKSNLLRMVYRTAGEGTRELSTYKKGQTVEILGVLGNGYDISLVEGKKVLLIGGGIGIPPMLLSAKSVPGEKEIVLGYANEDLFLKEEFEAVAPTHIATMDGSVGTKGTVLDAIKEKDIRADVIFACGPMPMLRAIKAYAQENHMTAYISLEERMACGVGACLGCVCKTVEKDHHTHVNNTRICVEGPVFNAADVDI